MNLEKIKKYYEWYVYDSLVEDVYRLRLNSQESPPKPANVVGGVLDGSHFPEGGAAPVRYQWDPATRRWISI